MYDTVEVEHTCFSGSIHMLQDVVRCRMVLCGKSHINMHITTKDFGVGLLLITTELQNK